MLPWRARDIEPGIVPRVGDVVLARKSPAAPFVRARILHTRRTRDGRRVRLALVWLEGERAGRRCSLYVSCDGWPPLVRPAA
jgi:hypothetical protein